MADAAQMSGDDRLVEINNELNAILEERITFLTSTLKTTESLTQQIANAELDIKRNQEMQANLENDAGGFDEKLAELKATTEELTSARDEKQAERFKTERQMQDLEVEIQNKAGEIEADEQKIKDLENELEKIERENKKLKNRVKVLEEGVTRMRKVREEYMRSIQDLNSEMKDLAASPEQEGEGGA